MSELAPPEVPPKLFEKTGICIELLDDDACKVVSRLRRKGHETFLVGGCVRDLLLRRTPKDFDVATAARPRQVKSLFRNCRIIGRRFKLAHLHFDQKILEVSTFRRRPDQEQNDDDEDDLLIRSDNAFGSACEDAHRRDFTINALFFDPETDAIHDYVGGIEDIDRGLVRTIGDPLTRIKEDPVRILRAIKFAARLGLRIDETTWQAMLEAAPDLSKSATPRLLEEITRLLRGGSAMRSFQLLRDCGALEVLLPELYKWIQRSDGERRLAFWRGLEALDSRVRHDRDSVTTPLLFATMLWPLFEDAQLGDAAARLEQERGDPEHAGDLGQVVEDLLGPLLRNLAFSRLESGRLKRILVVQRRFGAGLPEDEAPPKRRGRGRSFRAANFVRQDYFIEALRLFELRCLARDQDWDILDAWSDYYAKTTNDAAPIQRLPASSPQREESANGKQRAEGPSRAAQPHKAPVQARGPGRENQGRENQGREGHGRDGERHSREREAHGRSGRDSNRNGKGSKRQAPGGRDDRGRSSQRGPRNNDEATRGKKRGKKRRDRDGGRAPLRIEPENTTPLPPLPDVELDPTEIPTYGSVLGDTGSADKIELERSKGKRARKRLKDTEEPYIPPPPPEDGQGGGDDDEGTFGDW